MIRQNITPDYKLFYRHQLAQIRSQGPSSAPAHNGFGLAEPPHAGLVVDPVSSQAFAELQYLKAQVDAHRASFDRGVLEPQTAADEQNLRAAREGGYPFDLPTQPLPIIQPAMPDPLRGPAPFNPIETVPGGPIPPMTPMRPGG